MSHSFSLAFRLDARAGDGIRNVVLLMENHIHLHDKLAVDLPATGFIPVVLGILHYSKTIAISGSAES